MEIKYLVPIILGAAALIFEIYEFTRQRETTNQRRYNQAYKRGDIAIASLKHHGFRMKNGSCTATYQYEVRGKKHTFRTSTNYYSLEDQLVIAYDRYRGDKYIDPGKMSMKEYFLILLPFIFAAGSVFVMVKLNIA